MSGEYDKLQFANSQRVADAAYALMDRVQQLSRNTHVVAVASVLLVMCKAKGIDPRVVLDYASSVVHDADHTLRPEFDVVRDVAENDL